MVQMVPLRRDLLSLVKGSIWQPQPELLNASWNVRYSGGISVLLSISGLSTEVEFNWRFDEDFERCQVRHVDSLITGDRQFGK